MLDLCRLPVWIVPLVASKRKLSHHCEVRKVVMFFNFVTKTVSLVNKTKIHTWPNSACIFFCHTWWSNTKFQHAGVWQMWSCNLRLENFWFISGLKTSPNRTEKGQECWFWFFFYPCEPLNSKNASTSCFHIPSLALATLDMLLLIESSPNFTWCCICFT